jgi:epoxyqueuosine reductase
MTLRTLTLTAAVKARARELGFDRVAVGPAAPPAHGRAFERWLDLGYGAGMEYLGRTREDRLDPRRLLPGARSVVAVALSYHVPEDDGGGWEAIARYARGRDYHDVMRPRLRALAASIEEAVAGATSRAAVDTSAVLERDLAARAGLGWFGKNTNLLAPGLGSWFFIGIVLTTAELAPDGGVADRCGTCTACLDACPTRAFVAPYVLDARRCISYLTIEHRGDVDEALRPLLGRWAFGCDVCQDVCPWNRRAAAAREPAFAPAGAFDRPESLLELDASAFRARFRGTALLRAKRSGLLRNLALLLGNRREAGAVGPLRRALDDEDGVVRRAAAWALARIGAPEPPRPPSPSG